jgi:predicted transcriptional regulator
MTKNLTVRLPDELAADAEALARVNGTSLNETVRQSLLKEVERKRNDPEFKARLTKIIEEDRELLERLAK